MARETLPQARIHDAILEFLAGRDDAVLFGAQAVNAYVEEPRMTQGVDVFSPRAAELAEELRTDLATRFHVALRVRDVVGGHHIFQLQEGRDRHLVDMRQVERLPPARRFGGLWVVEPAHLVAHKVIAAARRRGRPRSFTDRRDVAVLLLRYPELRDQAGPVGEILRAPKVEAVVLEEWREIVAAEIQPDDEGT